jgi:hypothetical protein
MTDNRYYRYLKLPFKFDPVEPDFSKSHHVKYSIQPHDEFAAWLDSLNLVVGFAEAFKKSPTDIAYPWSTHLDGNEFDDHVKINFIYGHGTSKMIWAKIKPGHQHNKKTTVVGTDYLWAPLVNCDIVAADPLWQPAVVNAGQLHDVVDVSETRICYSFMLRHKNSTHRLLWDDAMTLFKDYLE